MAFKRAFIKPVLLGFVFVLGVGVGSVRLTNVLADSQPQTKVEPQTKAEPQTQYETKVKDDFPKNKEGKAYGSLSDAKSFEDAPDLVSAVGVDGMSGYVKLSELFGNQPTTPQEAIEQQKKRVPGSRYIPLYDVDGKTVIGKFEIGVPDENDAVLTVKGSGVTE